MKLFSSIVIPSILTFAFVQPFSLPDNPSEVKHEVKTEQTKTTTRVSLGYGINLIVKGLGLNIDNIRFVKEPKATDYVTKADNKAFYAQSFIIASCNGIKLSKTANPALAMTREQFALRLNEAIQSTGQYPVNMMFIIIKDEKSFSAGASAAVQNLIKFNVLTLENGNFRPKAYITRTEASKMVKNAASFIKSHKEANAAAEAEREVTMSSSPVSPEVNKVVLSRGSKPNSGYQINIVGISFVGTEAVVRYKLTDPAAGNSYMQVITAPKAETFISSAYKVVLKRER
jgi:hypothetical protein